jgi:O-succinylbenzoic acid--CoA ligase
MIEWLDTWASRTPRAPCLVADSGVIAYSEMASLVDERRRRYRSEEPVVLRPRLDESGVVDLLAVEAAGATAVVVGPEGRGGATDRVGSVPAGVRTVVFTSGGPQAGKGVLLTPANWEAAAAASQAVLGNEHGDRWLGVLPLHHVGGLGVVYRSLQAGGSILLEGRRERLATALASASIASLVPTQLERALRQRSSFPHHPLVLVGGAPASSGLLDRAEAAGLRVLPTYGMTETTGQVATARFGDRRLHPLPGVEVSVGPGGRIRVRGPTVSPGYLGGPLRRPEEWFITSDRGRIDHGGAVEVLGRADRMIITGGEKVDPALVEAALLSHPQVSEAAVVGLDDPEWGQVVAAAFVGEASAEELAGVVRAAAGRVAVPKRWLRRETLPRTDLDKVDQAALQGLFAIQS